jgi:hypothetical protein
MAGSSLAPIIVSRGSRSLQIPEIISAIRKAIWSRFPLLRDRGRSAAVLGIVSDSAA